MSRSCLYETGDYKTVECGDIDYYKGAVIYSHDIGKGSQHYRLEGDNWHKDGISGQVAIVGPRVYFLRVQKRLWAFKLCSCKLDGGDEKEHYKEEDGGEYLDYLVHKV